MNNEIQILVSDRPIKSYYHNNRWFVEGRNGQEFSIRLRNNTSQRKLAILSIDSINVIDGGVSTESGYVIPAYASINVKGFRTSNDSVNAFKFASKDKSYAAKSDATGRDTSNVGIIGCKFFLEYSEPTYSYINNIGFFGSDIHTSSFPYLTDNTMTTCSTSPSFSCNSTTYSRKASSNYLKSYNPETPNFDLGTEFSKKQIESKVSNTEFRKGQLDQLIEIFYASKSALISMGVIFEIKPSVAFPQSFPNFCKPPRD